MDTETRGFPRRDVRVSDAERDQAIDELSAHFQAGRLTQEEFEDRSGRALQARTGSDLTGLFTDLPRGGLATPQPAGAAAGPGLGGPVVRGGRLPVARVVVVAIIAAIVAGNVAAGTGVRHGNLGWLVPVLILGFLFLRLCRRR